MIRRRLAVAACGLALSGWGAMPASAIAAPGHPIVVIVLENKSYDTLAGSKNAPYINGTLIPSGKLFSNYYAPTPGSVKNYMAMTSGLIDVTAARNSDNIFHQLQGLSSSGVSWAEYEEDMPSTCYTGPNVSPYMKGHNPAVAYKDIKTNSVVCNAHVLPYSDFDPTNIPDFAYVVPNEYNDMHTGATVAAEIQTGDMWLSQNVPAMLRNGAEVILTFDEGNSRNEHIVTLEIGAGVAAATTDGGSYGHYSLLAGLEDACGLPRLNAAVNATPLPI